MNIRTIIGILLIVWGCSVIFNFNIGRFIFPAFFIFMGVMLLLNQTSYKSGSNQGISSEDVIKAESIFSSVNRTIETDEFKGGKVDVVFGGGEIDLRKAKIAKGETAHLEVNAVFGGVKIIVPENWAVRSSVSAVFGGFENQAKTPTEKPAGILEVKGAVVFGGGEIANKED